MPRSDTKIRSQLCSFILLLISNGTLLHLSQFKWLCVKGLKQIILVWICYYSLVTTGYLCILDSGHTFSPLTRVVIENKLAVCDISALCCVISTLFLPTIACHGKQIVPLTADKGHLLYLHLSPPWFFLLCFHKNNGPL